MKTVLMKIHAGGAWEGHVVYVATNPDNLEEVTDFCSKRGLEEDKEFLKIVKEKLEYHKGYGFVVPADAIEQNTPFSSASAYIKKHFPTKYSGLN